MNDKYINLKFINKKYLSNFIKKGELHFSTLGDIRNIEIEKGNYAIGDRKEASDYIEFRGSEIQVTIDGKSTKNLDADYKESVTLAVYPAGSQDW